MLQETLTKIEQKLHGSESISEEKKAELLGLVSTLKAEINELSKTNKAQAQSIADFTHRSTHEATRKEPKPEMVQHSLDELNATVTELQQSHPRLVQVVNSITSTLSNLGI